MPTEPARRITAKAAAEAWQQGALLIDVRSPTGRARNGELAGAIVVGKADVVDFVTRQLGAWTGGVVLFCGSLAGTTPLIEALAAAGQSRVAEVEGGFAALAATGVFAVSEPLLA